MKWLILCGPCEQTLRAVVSACTDQAYVVATAALGFRTVPSLTGSLEPIFWREGRGQGLGTVSRLQKLMLTVFLEVCPILHPHQQKQTGHR